MDVLIKNKNLKGVVVTLANARARLQQQDAPLPARVLSSIRKIMTDVSVPLGEYQQLLPEIKQQYIAPDGEGGFKTEDGNLVGKTEPAAQAYIDFMNEENKITLRRPITEADWQYLLIKPAEEPYLRLVSEGEAQLAKTEQESNTNKKTEGE